MVLKVFIAFLISVVCVFSNKLNAKTPDDLLCLRQTAAVEKKLGIKTNLLSAIALVESGKYDKDYPTGISWPWTVTSGGSGTFYNSKQEAIAAVEKLKAEGVENIDVGCMQVNLKFHPDAFKNLDEAFDVRKNVAYAAKFLKENYERTGQWGLAAVQYHSKQEQKALKYEDKLLNVWEKLKKHGNPAVPNIQAIETEEKVVDKTEIKKKEKPRVNPLKPRKPKFDKKAEDEKAKRSIMEWRKAKIEEWLMRNRPPESEEPIFEDARSDNK